MKKPFLLINLYMTKIAAIFLSVVLLNYLPSSAQDTLPNITIKNLNEQIIVSWKNNYKKPIANINIQRSYDSTKNFYTIGSVLNPQSAENGYADTKPPYKKMYYRVFVAFEGGSYTITPSRRPVRTSYTDSAFTNINPWQQNPPTGNEDIISYPSRKIFTNRDNNIAINLPNADTKNFFIQFFDDRQNMIFEIKKIPEQYYIIEKVNFVHSGWFYFKLFENGNLVEENKFFVPKDGKH